MNIIVIVATAYKRNDLLIVRSLKSIYKQRAINKKNIKVLIIDDNDESQILDIKRAVTQLRSTLRIKPAEFETIIIPNTRTKNYSGTGAWNTGIFSVNDLFGIEDSFIAILDDDDEYMPAHLNSCLKALEKNPELLGIFEEIEWLNDDGSVLYFPLVAENLNEKDFFIGNPGIQGSNMFFKTKDLIEAGAFNENFPSTTDRELMIRWIRYLKRTYGDDNYTKKIKILNSQGVIHHNHTRLKVTNQFRSKQKGLEMFYDEYKNSFSEEDYKLSINRARLLFGYKTSADE
jgi:hypothetical protein